MISLPVIEEPGHLNSDVLMYWNWAFCEMNRITHSLDGPQTGPTMASRAFGLAHLAMHDAWFAIKPPTHGHWKTFLEQNSGEKFPSLGGRYTQLPVKPAGATDAETAVAAAALRCLRELYGKPGNYSAETLGQLVAAVYELERLYVNGFTPPVLTGRDGDLTTPRWLEPSDAPLAARAFDPASPSAVFGNEVALRILGRLAIRDNEPGAGDSYTDATGKKVVYSIPSPKTFDFFDEPSNPIRNSPVRRDYHGPYYGKFSPRFAVTKNHVLADPPRNLASPDYIKAYDEVVALGGAVKLNSTKRSPDQSVAAYFWAYDGARLIGTPPRLYNQILRRIASLKMKAGGHDNTSDYVRLFALANSAMSDAGVLAWDEKYTHNYWRPLSGVREGGGSSGPPTAAPYTTTVSGTPHVGARGIPDWEVLGAPKTNTHEGSFKPPFPAYPSGHATFGAACLQMVRLFYKWRDGGTYQAGGKIEDETPDNITFDFVSDELNGISRDTYQPLVLSEPIQGQQGLVRTRIVRKFNSLWDAIYENAASRVFLGVHWHFDAFAGADVLDTAAGVTVPPHKDPSTIKYKTTGPRGGAGQQPIGGVPLGLTIANDIFANEMKQPANYLPAALVALNAAAQAAGVPQRETVQVQRSSTNIQ